VYDIMHPGSLQGDVEWYCRKATASGGPVLELGAGTGRIAIPVAEAGIRITAVDSDEQMLARLREKAAALHDDVRSHLSILRGDMRSIAIDSPFALVIIPFRAFLHNLTRDDQLAALKCAHQHLAVNGELALNVFHPSLQYMAARAGDRRGVWRWTGNRKLVDGGFVVYSDTTRYDTVRQRLHSLIRTEQFGPDGSLMRTHMMDLELAYLYPSDIVRLLDEAGFELVRMSGDFHGRPFERDGDELVVEARKRP
jgi:SAM-dependent methyltransferase